MARLPDGTYELPEPDVSPGEVIQSAWANSTMHDIQNALTDSLSRTGSGTMQAPLQFGDGTANAPGITWGNEDSSGLYRAGLNDMRVSIGGSDLFRWSGTNVQVWVTDQWRDVVYAGSTSGLPAGTEPYQTMNWDNNTSEWKATSQLLVNEATGNVTTQADVAALTFTEDGELLSAKYLGVTAKAADSTLLNGNNEAFYRNAANLNSGTIPAARVNGQTYTINVSGNATTATTAANSTKWGGYDIVVGPTAGSLPNTIYFVI